MFQALLSRVNLTQGLCFPSRSIIAMLLVAVLMFVQFSQLVRLIRKRSRLLVVSLLALMLPFLTYSMMVRVLLSCSALISEVRSMLPDLSKVKKILYAVAIWMGTVTALLIAVLISVCL